MDSKDTEYWDTSDENVHEIHIAENNIFISYMRNGERRQRIIPISNVIYYDYPPETAEPEYTSLERH